MLRVCVVSGLKKKGSENCFLLSLPSSCVVWSCGAIVNMYVVMKVNSFLAFKRSWRSFGAVFTRLAFHAVLIETRATFVEEYTQNFSFFFLTSISSSLRPTFDGSSWCKAHESHLYAIDSSKLGLLHKFL